MFLVKLKVKAKHPTYSEIANAGPRAVLRPQEWSDVINKSSNLIVLLVRSKVMKANNNEVNLAYMTANAIYRIVSDNNPIRLDTYNGQIV